MVVDDRPLMAVLLSVRVCQGGAVCGVRLMEEFVLEMQAVIAEDLHIKMGQYVMLIVKDPVRLMVHKIMNRRRS